ncbi:hypothetical protein ACJVC5_08985 [Peredibacter sp. HCB2-198]|uniref:hypothetical protein n=1 Tax=Peredibacter sp. HCB2-198 TaxID=3383025 RepID=UPI0038B4CDF0
MKLLLGLFCALSAFSSFAYNDLNDMVFDKNCDVVVQEDIYFLHSTIAVLVGSANLTALHMDRDRDRRLAAGRRLKVHRTTHDRIIFDDSAVRDLMILANNNGMPIFTKNLSVSDIATYSAGTLYMECRDKETVDM